MNIGYLIKSTYLVAYPEINAEFRSLRVTYAPVPGTQPIPGTRYKVPDTRYQVLGVA